MRNFILLLWVAALNTPVSAKEKRHHEAHVHGAVTMNIASEGKKVELEIDAPGESIIGFEHAAKSAVDILAEKKAINTLKSSILSIVEFDKDRGCQVTKADVSIEREGDEKNEHADDHHKGHHDEHGKSHHDKEGHKGEHSEVEAAYEFACKQNFAGSGVKVKLNEFFPRINEVTLTVITENGTIVKKLAKGEGAIARSEGGKGSGNL